MFCARRPDLHTCDADLIKHFYARPFNSLLRATDMENVMQTKAARMALLQDTSKAISFSVETLGEAK